MSENRELEDKKRVQRAKAMQDESKKDPDLKGFSAKKRLVLFCLKVSRGIVSVACKNAGISNKTYYNWVNKDHDSFDEEFKEAADDIRNYTHDFVESKLMQNIDSNDQRAIEYYLSNNARDRGYSSANQKVDVTTNGKDIQQTPLVFVSVDDLSPEELEAYKRKYLGEDDDAGDNNEGS